MSFLFVLFYSIANAKIGIELPPQVEWPQGVSLHSAEGVHFFQPSLPVLVVLGYFSCPHACHLLLEGVRDLVKVLPESFEVWFMSLDPRENSKDILKAEKRLDWREAKELRLFTLEAVDAERVAKALGFHFEWGPRAMAHGVGLYVFGPSGRLSGFFPGTHFSPAHVRLALVSASKFQQGDLRLKFQAALFSVEQGAPRVRQEVWFLAGGLSILIGFWSLRRKKYV